MAQLESQPLTHLVEISLCLPYTDVRTLMNVITMRTIDRINLTRNYVRHWRHVVVPRLQLDFYNRSVARVRQEWPGESGEEMIRRHLPNARVQNARLLMLGRKRRITLADYTIGHRLAIHSFEFLKTIDLFSATYLPSPCDLLRLRNRALIADCMKQIAPVHGSVRYLDNRYLTIRADELAFWTSVCETPSLHKMIPFYLRNFVPNQVCYIATIALDLRQFDLLRLMSLKYPDLRTINSTRRYKSFYWYLAAKPDLFRGTDGRFSQSLADQVIAFDRSYPMHIHIHPLELVLTFSPDDSDFKQWCVMRGVFSETDVQRFAEYKTSGEIGFGGYANRFITKYLSELN